jgi:hypothetical protein
MFTKTFTIECHIEELRAELRATTDAEEARAIRAELEAALLAAADLQRENEAADLTSVSESGVCRSRFSISTWLKRDEGQLRAFVA